MPIPFPNPSTLPYQAPSAFEQRQLHFERRAVAPLATKRQLPVSRVSTLDLRHCQALINTGFNLPMSARPRHASTPKVASTLEPAFLKDMDSLCQTLIRLALKQLGLTTDGYTITAINADKQPLEPNTFCPILSGQLTFLTGAPEIPLFAYQLTSKDDSTPALDGILLFMPPDVLSDDSGLATTLFVASLGNLPNFFSFS